MNTSGRPLLDRLMRVAFGILLIAIALSLSWHLIRSILPVLLIGAVLITGAVLIRNYRRW